VDGFGACIDTLKIDSTDRSGERATVGQRSERATAAGNFLTRKARQNRLFGLSIARKYRRRKLRLRFPSRRSRVRPPSSASQKKPNSRVSSGSARSFRTSSLTRVPRFVFPRCPWTCRSASAERTSPSQGRAGGSALLRALAPRPSAHFCVAGDRHGLAGRGASMGGTSGPENDSSLYTLQIEARGSESIGPCVRASARPGLGFMTVALIVRAPDKPSRLRSTAGHGRT
jgi:hypothetical protein